eukprot:jgi/Chrzof1/4624/Cz14g20120.t1
MSLVRHANGFLKLASRAALSISGSQASVHIEPSISAVICQVLVRRWEGIIICQQHVAMFIMHACRTKQQWQRKIKRGVHTLHQPEFQIMYMEDGVVPEGPNRDVLKVIRPTQRYA